MSFIDELEELESAEAFMRFFDLPYDESVVQVNRLHILQRFHDYLAQGKAQMPEDEQQRYQVYKQLLARAYQDFVESDARTEKVFKVFNRAEPETVFISLNEIQS